MGLGSPRLPGQARAKELTIRTVFHEYEFYGMLCLLNSFPLLEKLCFEVGQQYIFQEVTKIKLLIFIHEYYSLELCLDIILLVNLFQ